LLAHGRWFSLGTPASSTTKTGRHDIAEILLKVALKHQKSNISRTCCNNTGIGVFFKQCFGGVFSDLIFANGQNNVVKLEKVGATKLADYTDQLVQHYKIDSLDTHAYLNRAALVGCKNQALSENYDHVQQIYLYPYVSMNRVLFHHLKTKHLVKITLNSFTLENI
jgi:hypothetical protein